ncbi:hypothetical protein GC207_07690 [bacterium]|nr:hypothetical protein [bacterium]
MNEQIEITWKSDLSYQTKGHTETLENGDLDIFDENNNRIGKYHLKKNITTDWQNNEFGKGACCTALILAHHLKINSTKLTDIKNQIEFHEDNPLCP